ncbi:MAG: Cthe_2314 family HEPN domain-containing protein [Oscillospiraceae bacterium]
MNDRNKSEINYLESKLSEVSYNPNRFKLMIGEDKFLFGVISANHSEAPFGKLMQYKTIYDTLRDLDWKIKLSFDESIKYAYSEPVQKDFSLLKEESDEERLAFYYIENALFRTSSLWDMLAQLYRLLYNIEIPKEKVYYKKIFNPSLDNSDNFKVNATEIYNYINQDDDTDCEGEWKGNHTFSNNLRNKMTHRNSPNVAVMSDYDMNLKHHPAFQIKRIIEDYVVVSQYINEVLNEIENEIMASFEKEETVSRKTR